MEGAATDGTSQAAESSKAMNLRGTETILLAEDHDSIREMARQSLVSFGYRVLAANDGEQAVRLCDEERPSLAVLDVVMPRLGGPATAAQLLARFPDLPILFTSGYRNPPAWWPRRHPPHGISRSRTVRFHWAEPFARCWAIRKHKCLERLAGGTRAWR